MLEFRNGRFFAYGLSFTMPDGFYLHDEQQAPFGLCCFSPDQAIYMMVKVAPEGEEIRASMQDFFASDPSFHPDSVVEPIIINGTRGYAALYHRNGVAYYEVRLRFARGQVVTFLAQSEYRKNRNLKRDGSVQAILQTIQIE